MSIPPVADIVSLEILSPERAILTYTAHGAQCQLLLGLSQVRLIEARAGLVGAQMIEEQRVLAAAVK